MNRNYYRTKKEKKIKLLDIHQFFTINLEAVVLINSLEIVILPIYKTKKQILSFKKILIIKFLFSPVFYLSEVFRIKFYNSIYFFLEKHFLDY